MSIGSLALRPGLSFRRGPLARPRDDAKDLAKADLLHIFIISGPSGSGKSTFMREFVEGRLPGNISRALPAESKHWLRTAATN
jgi:ATP/maltotriose-dependent transcriptional regulator MalT